MKKTSDPAYGTKLYRDRHDPDIHYLSVLCGGVGLYERVFVITRTQFEELSLDTPSRLGNLAHDLAHGRSGFEEVQIERTNPCFKVF